MGDNAVRGRRLRGTGRLATRRSRITARGMRQVRRNSGRITGSNPGHLPRPGGETQSQPDVSTPGRNGARGLCRVGKSASTGTAHLRHLRRLGFAASVHATRRCVRTRLPGSRHRWLRPRAVGWVIRISNRTTNLRIFSVVSAPSWLCCSPFSGFSVYPGCWEQVAKIVRLRSLRRCTVHRWRTRSLRHGHLK